jgi:hypothetical protein
MGSLVPLKTSLFAPFKELEASFTLIETPLRVHGRPVGAVPPLEQHEFPEASTSHPLPVAIRDEMLEFYVFVFCQGGFRQLGMTFEQFLLVAAAIKPADLPATREEAWTL